MCSPRELWLSARPNGAQPPGDINRVELRICDRIDDPKLILAITALLETIVMRGLWDTDYDPLVQSPGSLYDLTKIIDENEQRVAQKSLNAVITCWQSGKQVAVRERLEETLEQAVLIAKPQGFDHILQPIRTQIEEGNDAMKWLKHYESGLSVTAILRSATEQSQRRENLYSAAHAVDAHVPH